MVGLDVKLVDFKVIAFTNFVYEVFNVASHAIELHWVFSVFGLPHKMEAVLAN